LQKHPFSEGEQKSNKVKGLVAKEKPEGEGLKSPDRTENKKRWKSREEAGGSGCRQVVLWRNEPGKWNGPSRMQDPNGKGQTQHGMNGNWVKAEANCILLALGKRETKRTTETNAKTG